ncbi:MAG: CRISPR-associated protein, partial [Bacteroidales bacterium]|nr:CRISPR-associated protein [Bacteroidales bacterium]
INLTNHPSSLWDKAQLQAAAQYGECVDMPFPAVDPEGDEEYVDRLTDVYLQKIMEIANNEQSEVTVHLMGEMSFTVSLVEKLRNVGISCILSTSTRQSKDLGNGQKEITFNFVRFRKYA